MKRKPITLFLIFLAIIFLCFGSQASYKFINDNQILSYNVDPKKQDVRLFWKDDNGKILGSFNQLKTLLKGKNKTLVFATNAGMFSPEYGPVGLFIQDGKLIHKMNNSEGKGNFNWKPNGVFYITNNNIAGVCQSSEFNNNGNTKYATQSGPMLVFNGKMHEGFENSKSLYIRNGVGVLPDGKVVFAMSKKEITFYDFAKYFLDLGCNNALYFDGAISKTYLPEQNWTIQDGRFGAMVGVVE
jgi:uncharacterized protein YigE (DUF2233 family)